MKEKCIKKIHNTVEVCNRLIRRDSENDNSWYAKGCALVKVAKETKDDAYYEQALECYSKAITLAPDNPLYLVDRSKLYMDMEKISLALEDIGKIYELASDGNEVNAIYIRNTIKNIEKKLGCFILPPEHYIVPLIQLGKYLLPKEETNHTIIAISLSGVANLEQNDHYEDQHN